MESLFIRIGLIFISGLKKFKSISFEKPAAKQACKIVEAGQEKELVSLLHQEAKVI